MSDSLNDIEKKIDAYVKGHLKEDEVLQLWAEFAKNPELLDQLELETGVRELVRRGAIDHSSIIKNAPVRKLSTWTWHAAAAAVLLLVVSVQLFKVDNNTSLNDFVINSISPDNLETSDGIRSKDMIVSTADSLLNLGFSAMISGNTKHAMELYERVISDFDREPYASKAFTNKGIIHYNDGEYEQANEAFDAALERVENSRMIKEKAWWYKANALVNLDRPEEALEATQQAYGLDGVFRKPAFLLLQKLSYDLGRVDFEDFEQQQGNN